MNAIKSILLLFPLSAIGTYINCTNGFQSDCHYNYAVNCSTSDSCIVDCGGWEGCSYSKIYCPANCTVLCRGLSTCLSATIYLPANSESSVTCNAEKACQSVSINIGLDSTVNLECIDHGSCNYMHVNATIGGSNLNIKASDDMYQSLLSSSIIGGPNSSINVVCTDDENSRQDTYACSGLLELLHYHKYLPLSNLLVFQKHY